MTKFHKLTSLTAALAMGLLTTPAFAQSDVTCGDFNAMDTETQHAALKDLQGPKGGKDHANAKARGADNVGEGISLGDNTSDDSAAPSNEALEEAGKDGQEKQTMATDLATMLEYCKGGDDLMLREVPQHPTDDNIAQ